MIKKIFAVLALCLASASSFAACSINFVSASDKVMFTISNSNGFEVKNYDYVCHRLRERGASLAINGTATVLSGVSIAFATVGVKDVRRGIATDDFGGSNIATNTQASQNIADELLMISINRAIAAMDIDKALASLDADRKRFK